MNIPLIVLVFQGIPELIAIVSLAFALANIPFEWKKICLMGVVLATTAYVLRLFPISFGIHTIILIGLLFIFLFNYCKLSIITSLTTSLISFLMLIIVESICLNLQIYLLGITWEMVAKDKLMRIFIGIPQTFTLFLFAFLIIKHRRRKYGGNT